ncbi:transcription factor SPT20 homolog [Ostrinia nubilalis]|uniref:transcription factor SPT20 homolog n=1 Tax=Ostrinia nubilalis TaxID=29057 RepID=UPI00308259FD
MKLTVSLLLLAAVVHAAEKTPSKTKQKTEDAKTDKRELAEGNAAVEKRAPVLPTALPPVTPGIEYADTKDSQSEKSPSQQIYATPLPQIAKISDLLSGQGPPFQAAIASHLYAPVSVYQPRLSAPTTYQVSNPIPSQLAYSEHKISYQPPQNAIQYSQPVQYNQKQQAPKQQNFARPINYQPYQQQIFVQPQPVAYTQQPQQITYSQQPQQIAYSQQPQILQIPQQAYQQIPQYQYQVQRPIQYSQDPAPQQFVQQHAYSLQQNLVQVAPQPGITYAREEEIEVQIPQKRLKSQEQRQETKSAEQQAPAPRKNYNSQPQGAVSYASFSLSQQPQSFSQPERSQPARAQYQSQPQPQYQAQQLYHQPQQQPQLPAQYHIEVQPQYQTQNTKQESIATAATKSLPVNPARQIAYFRPGPSIQQIQPQYQHQPQAFPQEQVLIQSPNHAPQPYAVAPSFPPVQYFGKFAHSIFGGQQH